MTKRRRIINDKAAVAKAVGNIVGKKMKVETKPRQTSLIEDPPEAKFMLAEKKLLINAFNQHGFHIFHDIPYLAQLLPLRSEVEIRSVIESLRRRASVQTDLRNQSVGSNDDTPHSKNLPLPEWQYLCLRLMHTFTRKINLSEIYVDCFNRFAASWNNVLDEQPIDDDLPVIESEDLQQQDSNNKNQSRSKPTVALIPDYKTLYLNFAQLLSGRFPEKMSPVDSYIAIKVFENINDTSSRLKIDLSEISDGSWAQSAERKANTDYTSAIQTLETLKFVNDITCYDFDERPDIRQLIRELPKIRRITDTINPLQIPVDLTQTIRTQLNNLDLQSSRKKVSRPSKLKSC